MCTDGGTSCGGGSERAARGQFIPSHLPSTRDALQRGIQSYWIRAPAQAYTSPSIPDLANVSWAREGHFHLDVGSRRQPDLCQPRCRVSADGRRLWQSSRCAPRRAGRQERCRSDAREHEAAVGASNDRWRDPATLSEFEPPVLNGAHRSVNRKVQGSNPCPGATSSFLLLGWMRSPLSNSKNAGGGSSKVPELDLLGPIAFDRWGCMCRDPG